MQRCGIFQENLKIVIKEKKMFTLHFLSVRQRKGSFLCFSCKVGRGSEHTAQIWGVPDESCPELPWHFPREHSELGNLVRGFLTADFDMDEERLKKHT